MCLLFSRYARAPDEVEADRPHGLRKQQFLSQRNKLKQLKVCKRIRDAAHLQLQLLLLLLLLLFLLLCGFFFGLSEPMQSPDDATNPHSVADVECSQPQTIEQRRQQ